jgi:hypothetical protein
VLFAGAAGAGVVAANLRSGTDERRPIGSSMGVTVRMAVVVMAMVMPVIVRMIMPATARVIDGGFQGFARQFFKSLERNGLGMSIG